MTCAPLNRVMPTPKMVIHPGTSSTYYDDQVTAALEPMRISLQKTLNTAINNPKALSPLYDVEKLKIGIGALLKVWNNPVKREQMLEALSAQEIKFLNPDGLAKIQIESIKNGQLSGIFSSAKKAVKAVAKVPAKVVKAPVQAAKFVKSNFQKVNPAMITARTAFRGLVALNFRGLATKIHNLIAAKKEAAVKKKWTGDLIGGNWGDLVSAVNAGYKKPQILGQLGEPVTIGASIAAATPVIVEITKVIGDAKTIADTVKPLIPVKKPATPASNPANEAASVETGNNSEQPETPAKDNSTATTIFLAIATIFGAAFLYNKVTEPNKDLKGITLKKATI